MNLADFGISEEKANSVLGNPEFKEIAEQIITDQNYADYVKFDCRSKDFGRLTALQNYWIYVNDRSQNEKI
jgi:hypothetical protein